MVLPSGFAFPPLLYTIGLLAGTVIVGAVLWRLQPRVTDHVIASFIPWIAFGAVLHVIYQLDAAPDWIRPLLGTPAAYVTTFVIAGSVWALSVHRGPNGHTPQSIAIAGIVVLCGSLVVVFTGSGRFRYFWPFVGTVLASGLTVVSWWAIGEVFPDTARTTGWAGVLAVFGQCIDGVSTAIGIDFLGYGERTPLARSIMAIAELLPTADVLGVGWLFVLVKLGLALVLVRFLTGLVREEPAQGYLFLLVVAAVGLGPGIHNLLLYLVA